MGCKPTLLNEKSTIQDYVDACKNGGWVVYQCLTKD